MSHISGDTDNHKAEGNLIPSSQWGNDVFVDAKLIEHNLLEINKKIAHCKPKIIGVTKYFGLNAMVNAYSVGIRAFRAFGHPYRGDDLTAKIASTEHLSCLVRRVELPIWMSQDPLAGLDVFLAGPG